MADTQTVAKNDTENVSSGKGVKGGYWFSAPLGTTIPTGFEPLDSAFVNLGFVTEDGITRALDEDSDDVVDMNGDTIATLSSSKKETFALTMAEIKADTMRERWGHENVTVDSNGIIKAVSNSDERSNRCYVGDFVLKGGRRWRTIVPNGKVTEVGEMLFASSDIVGIETTVTAFPGSDGNSVIDIVGKPITETVQEA